MWVVKASYRASSWLRGDVYLSNRRLDYVFSVETHPLYRALSSGSFLLSILCIKGRLRPLDITYIQLDPHTAHTKSSNTRAVMHHTKFE